MASNIYTPPPPGVPAAIPQTLVVAAYLLPTAQLHVRMGPQSDNAANVHAALAFAAYVLSGSHGGTPTEHLQAALKLLADHPNMFPAQSAPSGLIRPD